MAQLPNAVAWSRPEYDLDRPGAATFLLERDRPKMVVHAAAWTDVDGCARQPALARRRNSDAVGELAGACAARGVRLVVVSTNEVFDGDRMDRRGYVESDAVRPGNPYGRSKAQGEQAALAAMGDEGLWIVRTAWLYGPPGLDFPAKIVRAADSLPPDEPLAVVDDEWGSPTFTLDLAAAILQLLESSDGGLFHVVNRGATTRFGWAKHVLARCRPARRLARISRREFKRASRVPAWAVLDSGLAAERGVSMRPWEAALDDYLPLLG